MPTNFQQLKVWEKSMELVEEVYRLVRRLPPEERYALSDQMRRAVVSIPSNIAEGHGRFSSREFVQFLSIAKGSLYELTTQLLVCVRVGYLTEADIHQSKEFCNEIERMLSAFITRINESNA